MSPDLQLVQRRLFTVPQWNLHHTWPTLGGLRSLIFHADENGFRTVIRKVRGRILIDEQAFFTWVDAEGMGK